VHGVTKHNIIVAGHRTTVRLEPVMWEALRDIANRQGRSVSRLATEIDRDRTTLSLTAALRVYVVDYYQTVLSRVDERSATTPSR